MLVEIVHGSATNGGSGPEGGRSFDRTEPKLGKSSGVGPTSPRARGRRPVIIVWQAEPCEASPWVIDRTIASRSIRFASRGRCSVIRMPGTFVAIGLNSPRTPSGASGFMSQMSMWLGPPKR